ALVSCGSTSKRRRPACGSLRSIRETKDCELAAERRVVGKRGVATDCAQTCRADLGRRVALLATLIDGAVPCCCKIRREQSAGETDTGPATDTREHGNILLSVMLERVDVADDAGRGLELVEFLAVLIDRLDVAFQRAVEDHVAVGRQCA